MTDKIKILIDRLRAMNYFDCVDYPSHTLHDIKQAADCIEELAGVIDDLMFENESKQKRINKLTAQIEEARFASAH